MRFLCCCSARCGQVRAFPYCSRRGEAGDAIIEQPSRLYHVCYRTQAGFTVIDIWADEQSFAAFGQTLGPAVRNAGLDADPAVYPVEQTMAQDGTRSS